LKRKKKEFIGLQIEYDKSDFNTLKTKCSNLLEFFNFADIHFQANVSMHPLLCVFHLSFLCFVMLLLGLGHTQREGRSPAQATDAVG
jgi:hypothetical protein